MSLEIKEENSFQPWTLVSYTKKSGKRTGNGSGSGEGGRYTDSERENFAKRMVDYKEVNKNRIYVLQRFLSRKIKSFDCVIIM